MPAHGLAPAELATCPACQRVLVVADPNVGRVFLGKWKVLRRLGQGGMGTVFLAEDLTVGREVALKFLDATLAQQQEYRSRFVREARVMAHVEHPNLVSLYGVEQDGDAPFLVMRFVRGAPLSKVMARGALSMDEALPVVAQLVAGLKALHARGFVHRDLKPGNVMLDDEGRVTLLDFGLTRGSESTLTRPGVALGSPHFMAPEQVMGGAVDARTDVYALGLITSELLVGHRPYPHEGGALAMQAHLFDEPERADVGNPAVPRAVADVLLGGALAKKPAERFASAQAFFEALLEAARPRATPLRRDEAVIASLAQSVPQLPEVAEVVGSDTVSVSEPAAPPRPSRSTHSTERDLPPASERLGPRPRRWALLPLPKQAPTPRQGPMVRRLRLVPPRQAPRGRLLPAPCLRQLRDSPRSRRHHLCRNHRRHRLHRLAPRLVSSPFYPRGVDSLPGGMIFLGTCSTSPCFSKRTPRCARNSRP
ncbi:MAG: protein kinase [Myxococcaceae bacterium]|jgi:serine/threonine-protein kinase|nr:protein kinase [Myxococcaceae bacterium]